MSTKRKQYSPEQRADLINKIQARYKEGVSIDKACDELNVRPTTYRNWVTQGHAAKVRITNAARKKQPTSGLAIPRKEPYVLNMHVPTESVPFIFIMGDGEQVGHYLERISLIVKGGGHV